MYKKVVRFGTDAVFTIKTNEESCTEMSDTSKSREMIIARKGGTEKDINHQCVSPDNVEESKSTSVTASKATTSTNANVTNLKTGYKKTKIK